MLSVETGKALFQKGAKVGVIFHSTEGGLLKGKWKEERNVRVRTRGSICSKDSQSYVKESPRKAGNVDEVEGEEG